jgi:methionyl-tRNA formyltransferase
LPDYVAGKITPEPQPSEGASYARKISREDGALDWRQPARTLWNRVRAFTPWPGAFTFQSALPKPRLLKIWEARVDEHLSGSPGEILATDKNGIVVACGNQALRILSLQREGGRRLSAQEFLAGNPLKAGDRLGQES